MAWAFGASIGTPVSDTDNQATSIALTTNVTVASGNWIYVGVSWYNPGVTASVADNGAGGTLTWTQVGSTQNGGVDADRHIAIFRAYAPSGLASGRTVTATFSGNAYGRALFGSHFSGGASGAGLDGTPAGSNSNSTSTFNPGNVTLAATDSLLVAVGWADGWQSTTSTAVTGTEAVDFNNSGTFNNAAWVMLYRLPGASGAQGVSSTFSGSASFSPEWLGITAGFAVGSAGTGHTDDEDDTASVTDAVAKAPAKTQADTLAGTDAQAKALTKALADTATLSDQVNAGESTPHEQDVDDTASVTDQLAKALTKALADTIQGADAHAKTPGKTVADAGELTDDGLALDAAVTFADALQIDDQVDTGGDQAFEQDVNDTLTGTDTVAKALSKALADTITGTDAHARAAGKTVADTVQGADGLTTGGDIAHQRTIDDTIAAADQLDHEWEAFLALADTLTATDDIDPGIVSPRWLVDTQTRWPGHTNTRWAGVN